MLTRIQIYLSGAMKNVEDTGWRERFIAGAYNLLGISVFNPACYYNYTDKVGSTVKECMNYFLHRIRSADVVVVNLDHSDESPGTLVELAVAHEHHVPIIGFTTGKGVYNWALEFCDKVFENNTAEDILDYINIYYGV